ncbi:MAG: hypothetical protein M0R80_29705 [Proteobacteria bacterium]|jgi:hypothetical protein|nr:hypothetical protein [Pseudomonadota bacterium]
MGLQKNPGKNFYIQYMNFKLWLEQELDLSFGYVSPDDLWTSAPEQPYWATGGFTFIYSYEDGLLTTDRDDTHGDLRKAEFNDRSYEHFGIEGRCAEIDYGKRGQRIFLITFWGKRELLGRLVDPCVRAIRAEIGTIGIPIVVSSSEGNRVIDKGQPQWQGPKISDADIDLLKQLHLMKSPEKKAARKELGLFSMKKRPDAEDRVLQPEHRR